MKIGFSGHQPTEAQHARLTAAGHEILCCHQTGGDLAGAEVVFLGADCAASTRDEIFGKPGLRAALTPGLILVDRSDSTAEQSLALGAELAALGVDLVEAPMSGHYLAETDSPPVTFLAGSEAARKKVLSLLEGKVLDCGPAGKGHALNLYNSTMGLAAYLATLEVASMGARFGLGIDVMADVITAGSGRNHASTIALPRLAAGQPAAGMPIGQALSLVAAFAAAGRRAGVPMLLSSAAEALLQAAANRHGPEASLEKAADLIGSMSASPLRGAAGTARPTPERTAPARVGYLGVGTMGGALARRLMLSRPMMVHDVNPALVDGMVADGAVAAPDAATLARECDIILICVPTSAIVRQAIFGPGGLAEGLSPGKIVIDQTTGNPSETRAIARDLADIGVRMVDAPVSGGTRGAVAGTIAIICGGEAADYAKVHSVLAEISPNIVYCGAIGNGHAAKLVQNATAACNRILTLECAAAAIRAGLTLTEMIAAIETASGWNGGAGRILPALRTGAATTDFAMGLMVKDLRLAMDLGNELGVPMMIANAARAIMQICANEEGMKANLDAVALTVEKLSGVTFSDGA